MCIVCIELTRGRLSSREAIKNLGEMVEIIDSDHLKEVESRIIERISEEVRESVKAYADLDEDLG